MKLIITAILLIIALWFWLTQFIELMGRSDDDFKVKYDKILWFITIFFGSLVGAFCYYFYKIIYNAESSDYQFSHKTDPKMNENLKGVLSEFVQEHKKENL